MPDPIQALRPLLHAFAEALAIWDAADRNRPRGDEFAPPTDHDWYAYSAAVEATEWAASRIGERIIEASVPWLYRYAITHCFPPDWYSRFIDVLSLKNMTPATALASFADLRSHLPAAAPTNPSAPGGGEGPTAGRRRGREELPPNQHAFITAYNATKPLPKGDAFYALADQHGITKRQAKQLRDAQRQRAKRATDAVKK